MSDDLTITPKPITVTADALSKIYGEHDPALTYQVSPALIPGDTFNGALSRDPGENVGTYAILQGTLTAGSNYTITFVSDDLTITLRMITVTADDQLKPEGYQDPPLTYQVTSGSLAFDDQFSGVLEREPGEAIGTYAIWQGTLAINANYNLSFVPGTLIIIPVVTVTVDDDQSKVYGEDDPVFTYTPSDPSVVFTGALSREPGEDVADYPITIGTLGAQGYHIDLITANFLITSNPITVTADDLSKIIGDADPPLTYQVTSGSLVFDDQFTGGLEREPGEEIGTYAILQGTLSILDGNNGANYTLHFIPGNFLIQPIPVFTIFLPLITR